MSIPIFTFVIILASLLSSILPEFSPLLIFDRNALVRGEIWRILTCHFVHFSSIHLAYNLFAFGVAGYVIEKKNYPHLGRLFFLLALAISISLFVLKPNMEYYGGLSGIACGTIYYVALMGIRETGPWKKICLLILLFLPIKIGIETYLSISVLPYLEHQSFVPIQTSHIIGCLVAVLFYFRQNKDKKVLTNQLTLTRENVRFFDVDSAS